MSIAILERELIFLTFKFLRFFIFWLTRGGEERIHKRLLQNRQERNN